VRHLDLNAVLRERKPTIVAIARVFELHEEGTSEQVAGTIAKHLKGEYGLTGKALKERRAVKRAAAEERELHEGRMVNQHGELVDLPSKMPNCELKNNLKSGAIATTVLGGRHTDAAASSFLAMVRTLARLHPPPLTHVVTAGDAPTPCS